MEFKAARVPKMCGSTFLPIFYLIFESFKGVGFTALIFWYIFHLIFDALCLQNKLRVDQKWLNNKTCAPLLSIMQFINNLVGEDVVSVSQTMESCTTDITLLLLKSQTTHSSMGGI